jgi:hypothetical protein
MPKGIYPRKGKIDTIYTKTKQTILTGKTLLMFEYDVSQQEEKESRLLRDIVKEHYKNNPPFGYGVTGQR